MNRGLPAEVEKRDGSRVPFDTAKITYAIERAAREVLPDPEKAGGIARRLTDAVLRQIQKKPPGRVLKVEAIQDLVETVLMQEGYSQIAKRYILYRERRADLRRAKAGLGLKDDLKLPLNTMEVLKRRYLLKDDHRQTVETPSGLFRRVASYVSRAEENFPSPLPPGEVEEKFYQLMCRLEFMPNSPTLMNAGTSLGQLSACFVLPVEDSIASIFETLKNMALIHQTGGGTGFSFSRLRPKGDLVASTKGEASGPVSFMSIFDKATEVIVQGGRRRGANMGIMRCDHLDIAEFIEAKIDPSRFSNFNLSVGATDAFMAAVAKGRSFALINPRTGKKERQVDARTLFDLIVNAAWRTGDPGLIFLDEINRRNPTPEVGPLEATNPCGELPLLPYESCNLGSINLARMVRGRSPDWEKIKETIWWGIRFLDDVIEVNKFPLPPIREITFANRKVGLGVMGFADLLLRLGIPYAAQGALDLAGKLMRFIRSESLRASAALARQRGVFPNFEKSIYRRRKLRLRNATVNTIAPTGTISIIAGCSSGIEPLFAVSFVRNVLSGTKLFEVNPIFEEVAQKRGFFSQDLIAEIAQEGSLNRIRGIPEDVRRLFVTAFDISPREHLQIQAAFQKYTDNSVSKTINLAHHAGPEDVRRIYLLAHRLKCKGITVYRYGSKDRQVLSLRGREGDRVDGKQDFVSAEPEYAGGCVLETCPL